MFSKHSYFNQRPDRLPPISLEPRVSAEREAKKGPPIEHWNHDLETVAILLEQDPPDLDRARRLLDEVRRELYAELR